MPVPALVGNGVLPPGRYECTQEEIEAAFVSADAHTGSISRGAIWQHCVSALELLAGASLVHSAWISGSFVTEKKNPRDIDVTFVINEEDRAKRSPDDLRVIESFIRRVRDPLRGKGLVPAHGLLVDSYIINWSPHHPDASGDLTPQYQSYAAERGYWDDWWSRKRATSKGAPPSKADAFPQRGYLEVNLNAYT